MDRETLDKRSLLVLRNIMNRLDVPWAFDHAVTPVRAVFDFLNESDGKAYCCHAAAEEQSLRLTVQALLTGEANTKRLRDLNELNAQWGMGRVYVDRSHGHFDVAAGLYLDAGSLDPRFVRATLAHLVDAGPSIRRLAVPSFQPEINIGPPCDVTRIHQVLAAQSLSPTTRVDQNVVGLRLAYSPALDFVMEFQVDEHQVLRVGVLQSNPVGIVDEEGIYQYVQDINRGLSFGTIFFDRSHGRLVYLMTVPLGWFTFDSQMARWLLQQASRVMFELTREQK